MSIWEYANPVKFMRLSGAVLPWVSVAAALCLVSGLVWGFFFTPAEARQGESVKFIYLHVPAALMAINGWFVMLISSLIWFIRRHHVSALVAKAAAPIGITMTLIALVTGALWGQVTWGTWWDWDQKLTAFLILFFFYLGYIALWQAVETPDIAADLTTGLCIVGSLFALLSRYAINYWKQGLHQDASLSVDAESHVANVYYLPLLVMIAGFVLLFVALLLLRTRTEIRARRMAALLARERVA